MTTHGGPSVDICHSWRLPTGSNGVPNVIGNQLGLVLRIVVIGPNLDTFPTPGAEPLISPVRLIIGHWLMLLDDLLNSSFQHHSLALPLSSAYSSGVVVVLGNDSRATDTRLSSDTTDSEALVS